MTHSRNEFGMNLGKVTVANINTYSITPFL